MVSYFLVCVVQFHHLILSSTISEYRQPLNASNCPESLNWFQVIKLLFMAIPVSPL